MTDIERDPGKKLNDRQRLFVAEYLVDLNATQAVIRAGYSENGARVQGTRLLANPNIAEAIRAAFAARIERTNTAADDVIYELRHLAFSTIADAFDDKGNLLTPDEWPEEFCRALASYEVVTSKPQGGEVEYVHKFRLWPKVASLELLGKHLRMWVDRIEHSADDSLVDAINAGRRRVADERAAREAM